MSYNTGSVTYIGDGRLGIRRGEAVALQIVYEDNLAEGNLFQRLDLDGDPDEILTIEDLWWYGEGSGRSIDTLIEDILPCTKGHAEIFLTWEDGDSFTGYEVEDSKVTKREVIITLGEVIE